MQERCVLIAASVACADFANLGQTVRVLERAVVDVLHFDFCDGHFAPTLLLSPMILRSLRPLTTLRFDVHLYCEYPSRYLDELARSGADLVVIQVESKEDYCHIIRKIRRKGMKAGVGVLPGTAIPNSIEDILADVSLIIANTVGPAYGGQDFDIRGVENMKQLSEMIRARRWKIDIGADGGVGFETLDGLLDAGANLLVCGTTCLFRSDQDIVKGVKTLKKQIESKWEKEGEKR